MYSITRKHSKIVAATVMAMTMIVTVTTPFVVELMLELRESSTAVAWDFCANTKITRRLSLLLGSFAFPGWKKGYGDTIHVTPCSSRYSKGSEEVIGLAANWRSKSITVLKVLLSDFKVLYDSSFQTKTLCVILSNRTPNPPLVYCTLFTEHQQKMLYGSYNYHSMSACSYL